MMAKVERVVTRIAIVYFALGLLTALITWGWFSMKLGEFVLCAIFWPVFAAGYIYVGIGGVIS
ncbi:hypothetical protein J2T19_000141 [Paenibacillus tundrae]|uniref:Uncharacterized protein n=1 Tax=Paenibacillus tundrae TaxID=528187 RepID=A0ABT9W644_9BACL|nr:hypothetical protein [Paenibacillus tundrae]